jgi:cold shock protein
MPVRWAAEQRRSTDMSVQEKPRKRGALTGIVKWFDPNKGYGFISRDGGKDVFVHARDLRASGIQDDLERDEELSFDLAHQPDGRPRAVNVERI